MCPAAYSSTVANVEAIERALCIRLQRGGLAQVQVPDAGAVGDVAGSFIRAFERTDIAVPVGAVLERLVGQRPANGAITKRHNLVGYSGIDQRLRADDRSGPSGAIDDNGGLGIWCNVTCTKHQFRAGHADRTWDVHGRIFVRPTDIQNLDIRIACDQRGDFFRRQ